MDASQRPARKQATTRSRIVNEALARASEEGLAGISLGRLASNLGMSKSGLFAHFRSKEELQLQIIDEAIERFREVVIRPAFAAPRGLPRLQALFDRWLDTWANDERMPGGCLFTHAAAELDDQPGPARDAVATAQQQWLDTIAESARRAAALGDLRTDANASLLAFQMHGIMLAYHQAKRLLRSAAAESLARAAFGALIESARPLAQTQTVPETSR
jgi:AcrR family transcriptional regulator